MALSEEHGFPLFAQVGRVVQTALSSDRATADGVKRIRASLTHSRLGALMSMFLGSLAEASLEGFHCREASAALDEAFAIVEDKGERIWEAELFRLRGELKSADQGEAETDVRRAIDVARLQQARSLELRATISLGRLLASQGRRDEARTMLADIYNWFTEGFDTADLKDAKALLDELAT
jgi:hypothetical protein